MGIRLDWEIEAERERILGLGEDPDAARVRRKARFQVILTVVIALILLALIVSFVLLRVEWANRQIEQLLRDTVAAEVASLRIGNMSAFVEFQRSESPQWEADQRALFEEYQTLIQRNENAMLTGRIVDLEIDHPRARVAVEEIIDGVPYTRLWFYWRYEGVLITDSNETIDGWRHVPPDYTFWGEEATFDGAYTTVNYHTVDEAFANAVGRRFDEWLTIGCAALGCDTTPQVEIEVRPDPDLPAMQWAQDETWHFTVRSPLVTRARADLPFAPELQIEAATLLAERLVSQQSGGLIPVYPADAEFLRQSIVSWLVGQFVLIDTGAYLINSIATNYGQETVGHLLNVMQQNDSIAVISQVTGSTLDQMPFDWRDFFTWRLAAEQTLAAENRVDEFLQLYDIRDPLLREAAQTRFDQKLAHEMIVTQVQANAPSQNGEPQVTAVVNVTEGETVRQQEVLFRLVDNVWLRAS